MDDVGRFLTILAGSEVTERHSGFSHDIMLWIEPRNEENVHVCIESLGAKSTFYTPV